MSRGPLDAVPSLDKECYVYVEAIWLAAAMVILCQQPRPVSAIRIPRAKGVTRRHRRRVGAIGGYLLGDLVGRRDRTERILGTGIGALAGGAVGAYMDRQEQDLRRQTAGTGVEVERQGDELVLTMPSGITFGFDRYDIQPQFRPTLDQIAQTLSAYPETMIDIYGHTDTPAPTPITDPVGKPRKGRLILSRLARRPADPTRHPGFWREPAHRRQYDRRGPGSQPPGRDQDRAGQTAGLISGPALWLPSIRPESKEALASDMSNIPSGEPSASRTGHRHSPPLLEELAQHGGGFAFAYPENISGRGDKWAVRTASAVKNRAALGSLRRNKTVEPGEGNRARAHRARLQRHPQIATVKTRTAKRGAAMRMSTISAWASDRVAVSRMRLPPWR